MPAPAADGEATFTIRERPLPAPIPRGPVADRLAVVDRISWQISVDAYATAEQLHRDGWSPDELAGALHGYREWWTSRVDAAVDAALVFWVAS